MARSTAQEVRRHALVACLVLGAALVATGAEQAPLTPLPPKKASALYPRALIDHARSNAAKFPWAAKMRDDIVKAAEPWITRSDSQLWALMFGNTIKRSWMVLSHGDCPACRKPVPMYTWIADPMTQPWKMQCPHCKELFPKNDFEKFYRSGLDEGGVFQPKRADRSLLFNADHPDAADPLHGFGVDDGEGVVQDTKRWRFIGAYLIYGQWKKGIVEGVKKLSAAYAVTGDTRYAHKAAVLLDRAADLYPTFDFSKEGILYEGPGARGYVSTWHDACFEVHDLTLAYDQIFEGLQDDPELVGFLSSQSRQHKLSNSKNSMAEIRRNIEERILQDTLHHRPKITSNYPTTDVAIALIHTVLGWPDNRAKVMPLLDEIIRRSTEVDGISGEKGLTGYATIAPRNVAKLIGLYLRSDPDFLKEMLARHPQLHACFRFHIDMWFMGQYCPRSGDTAVVAARSEYYQGVDLSRNPGLEPSGFTFLWNLYRPTKDLDFVRVLYNANTRSVDGLPFDLFAENPDEVQREVERLIAAHGPDLHTASVNKQNWHLAMLRSGQEASARAIWLDYDSGGGHGHKDGMTLGLFAHGLDLLPDFGYPPVQYGGGWGSPKAVWYTLSAAHNTVIVDGQSSKAGDGRTTLWADGKMLHLIRASGPSLIGGTQFERTAALIDLPGDRFYVVDLFRVIGGKEHLKLVHGHFGELETDGLQLQPGTLPIAGAQMRNFQTDSTPRSAWNATLHVDDHYKYLPAGTQVNVRHTDLTSGASAWTAESWVSDTLFASTSEAWLPTIMTRRTGGSAPLASCFISTLEAFKDTPPLRQVRRLPLRTTSGAEYGDGHVALECTFAGGGRDLIVSADADNPPATQPATAGRAGLTQPDWDLELTGEFCLVRRDAAGKPIAISLCRATSLRVGGLRITLKPGSDCLEIDIADSKAKVSYGSPESVVDVQLEGRSIWSR